MKYRRISKEVKLTTFTALVLAVFILPALFSSLFLVSDSYATASSISISLSGAPTVNIASSSEGKFADSGNNTITITTTHAAGYTLTAKASNSTNLEGINGGSIPSITSAVSPTNYADNTYASSHNLNDTWAYKPSVLYNASTQATNPNTDYLPSPGTGTAQSPIDTLAVTNDANDGSYTVSIGARVTTATAIDEYSNSFIFAVVGNPTPYAITYNKNTTDTVTNMPANHTTSDPGATDETITIDSTVPVRDGYIFKGWCSTATSDDTCSGTVYNPDGGGTSLNLTINQTSSTNAFTLYAMWGVSSPCKPSGTTINTIACMQDISSFNKSSILTSMTSNQQYKLIDSRDSKEYWVAKLADGNIWMTQNLDLEIGGSGVAALTSENTDIDVNTAGTGIYTTDYSVSGGIATWSPNPTNITPSGSATNNTLTGTPAEITNFASGSPANSVTGWVNDNNMPYMAEGGDHYVYTSGVAGTSTLDTIYSSAEECTTTGGHTAEECAHYQVGNYYNWTAAIASSASNNISTQYDNATNSICPKGWKLPSSRASSDTSTTRQFGYLWQMAGITSSLTATSYATNGFLNIRQAPLFFARGGYVNGTTFNSGANLGGWWSSTVYSATGAYRAYFNGTSIYSANNNNRPYAYSLRCLVQ